VLLGAKNVIVIDRLSDRLSMAKAGGADEIIDFEHEDVFERLNDLTQGKGPEKCIDAVGLKSHATAPFGSVLDRAIQAVMLKPTAPTFCAR